MIFSVDFDFLNCVVLCVISGLIILGVPSDCAPPGAVRCSTDITSHELPGQFKSPNLVIYKFGDAK